MPAMAMATITEPYEKPGFVMYKKKAEALANARPFDVTLISSDNRLAGAVEDLYAQAKAIQGRGAGHARVRKNALRAVLLNLYEKWETDPDCFMMFRRDKAWYSKTAPRYNPNGITRTVINAVDDLIALGYVEYHPGHYDRSGQGRSHISRIRATKKLIEFLEHRHSFQGLEFDISLHTECIILRDHDPNLHLKHDIDYRDTPRTRVMRMRLHHYNNLLRGTHIDIPGFPLAGIRTDSGRMLKINRRDKFVRRVFSNGTWDDGGRYYGGWWQRIPSEWRQKIEMNGLPIVEVDYSGLHIVLLYHMEGIDYWKDVKADPYILPGYTNDKRMRKLLKMVLLIALNAKNKASAAKAIRKEIFQKPSIPGAENPYSWAATKKFDLARIIDAFADHHAPIKSYFFTGIGIKLQRIDSMIASHVVNELTEWGKPVLCVHDSFIVNSTNQKELEMYMQYGFQGGMKRANSKTGPGMSPIATKWGGIGQSQWYKRS